MSVMPRAMENTRAGKKTRLPNMKRKTMDNHHDPLDTDTRVKKPKLSQCHRPLNSRPRSEPGPCEQPSLVTALRDSWEVDSGFSSEASPPASGRSSPCLGSCPSNVVALDCEMVGTGPGGHCSELARCSILDYHGNVLYDKYVRPCQPVTDFRTRWSGIQRHHLHSAVPFTQAKEEICCILEGKVVIGHSIYNDFEALDMIHPAHMVRDTCTTHHLSRLAGFPRKHCVSLKILASRLLNRKIQVGRRGHCSVEDALASLHLYKLVEAEWEQELYNKLRDSDAPHQPGFLTSNHYMQDEYWPDHIMTDSQ